MSDLRYEAPESVSAAVALLAGAKGTTRVLAGGTDVIVQMDIGDRVVTPHAVVAGDAVRQMLFDQPVKHAVDRNAINTQ